MTDYKGLKPSEQRVALFNELMDVLKKAEVPLGLAKAVLGELDHELSRAAFDTSLTEYANDLRTKAPCGAAGQW